MFEELFAIPLRKETACLDFFKKDIDEKKHPDFVEMSRTST